MMDVRMSLAVGQREYPYVPGMEVSGEVIEVGSAVTGYSVGDRVFGAPLNGAFQPECLVQSENVHRIPTGVDPSICAGFELNYGTAVRGQAFRVFRSTDISKLRAMHLRTVPRTA